MLVLLLYSVASSARPIPPEPSSSPYPPSPVISKVDFNWASSTRLAPGSDNWPLTWAAGGDQYTTWGDGGGFGGTNSDSRVSLGIARVEGDDPDLFSAVNVSGGKNSLHPAALEGKSYGILALGETLFLWVSPGSDAQNYAEARLAVSQDGGAAWEKAGWAFKQSDHLALPAFLQFGPGCSGARDHYVYVYAIRLQSTSRLAVQQPGQIDLLRVQSERLMDREAYEFFAGFNPGGEPAWTADIASRRPVFEDRSGVGWTVSAVYNAGLGRYLLATEHDQSFKGNLGLFDAPQPWGPWTTVLYELNWESRGENFYWNFSNKWTSLDGIDFVLVYTGTGENDAWNSVRGRFTLAGSDSTSDLE